MDLGALWITQLAPKGAHALSGGRRQKLHLGSLASIGLPTHIPYPFGCSEKVCHVAPSLMTP